MVGELQRARPKVYTAADVAAIYYRGLCGIPLTVADATLSREQLVGKYRKIVCPPVVPDAG